MTQPKFLRRKDAANYLREKYNYGSEKMLAKEACVGGGPRFRKIGRFPIYTLEDLDEYALGKMSGLVRSTSELYAVEHSERVQRAEAADTPTRGSEETEGCGALSAPTDEKRGATVSGAEVGKVPKTRKHRSTSESTATAA